MGRKKPAPVVVHRLNAAEQRVLASFLAGRLPAGQLHMQLEHARTAPPPATTAAPAVQPTPAVAA
jgi:hypothetical protein